MIGVLGGSFDPVHFGHINPLIELSEQFKFDEIRLVPTYKSPINKSFYASAEHRFNMVSIIASSGTNNFVADNTEILKEDISYTYETIKIIKKQKKSDDICLIMGFDVFLNFETWYNYLEIIKEVNIIVINRPNFSIKNINNMDSEILKNVVNDKIDFLRNDKKKIFFYDIPSIDISSTKIRDIIKKGDSLAGLVPGSKQSYIKRNRLYVDT